MREYITPGEVAAVLGKDAKVSRFKIWDRLSSGEQSPIGDYGRWQGRLASSIMEGVATDHGLRITTAIESAVKHDIMPPRLWSVGPCLATNGRPGVLYVGQRQSPTMFGWKAPAGIPEKDRLRMLAIATATECDVVLYGVLIDGYQSSLFVFETNQAERDALAVEIAEFIQSVRDDIEPGLDYAQDAKEIKAGAIAAKPLEASAAEVEALAKEMREKQGQLATLTNQSKQTAARIGEIEATLLHILMKEPKLETECFIITKAENAAGKKSIQIADKKAAPLF